MRITLVKYFLFILTLSSCATANKNFEKKRYRKSKTLATYSGGANELQDGYLVLKENGYFNFYQKLWLIVSIRQTGYVGRYAQLGDTLYLNWLNTDPKQIKYYLSKKAVIDSTSGSLWFIDERTNERLWGLGLTMSNKQ
jgi:hypothetical protein